MTKEKIEFHTEKRKNLQFLWHCLFRLLQTLLALV